MLNRLLDRPVSVSMIALVLVILGCVGISSLPVGLIPDVDIPYVTVQVDAPDMSARELDELVVRNLRQNLIQIYHLNDIHTEARDGGATLTLDFDQGCNMDFAFIEVNEKIDRSMSSLPGISRPKVLKASATDIPAFFINVTQRDSGTDSFMDLSDFTSNVLAKRIEQLDEVAMVDISGSVRREILIVPDLDRLTAIGMSVDAFRAALSEANVRLTNLMIRDGEYRYNVNFRSFASDRDDIASVYFKSGDRIFRIDEVASVQEQAAPASGLDRSDGRLALSLAVIKQSDARMSDLKKAMDTLLGQFREDYPEVEFALIRDQTELLEYSISNLILNIIIAILLDCLIIFLFMKDLRSPLLVSLSIPLSLVISFFALYLLGMSVNIISLSGMLLGVGMMVDNAIVLTDNITARWLRGDTLRDAVVLGTGEVSGAMLSSVLTTCAVFIPLVFLNGLAGDLFFDQAVTVTVLLLVSYLVTVVLLPVYYHVLYRRKESFTPNRFLAKLEFGRGLRIYDNCVNFFLGHRWLVWALPLLCCVLSALSLNYMTKTKLPPISYSDAILNIDWNSHISLEENCRRIAALEEMAGADVLQISSMVGVQQFALSHSPDQAVNEASIYFKCDSPESLENLKSRFAGRFSSEWPDAVYEFGTSGNIFEMVFGEKEAELTARLRASSGDRLTPQGVKPLVETMDRALPMADIAAIPVKKDVLYIADPELLSLYGVSREALSTVLRQSLNGNQVFDIVQGNRTVPVVLGTDKMEMEDLFSTATVQTEEMEIPLRKLLRQTFEEDFKTIVSGEEGNYYPVAIDVRSSDARQAMETVRGICRDNGGYEVSFTGAYFTNAEMIRQMTIVLLIALALLFLILASQFESLLQPFIILSEIVIDLGFCLVFLWITGAGINMMSLIGTVVVCGIVINDSILKIDTINQLVKAGMEVEAAIHESGHRRLKAIIMTSLTTVLSVAPFLSRGNMGADLQYPMALVIIIGMTVGTLVSLFYVPAVYSFLTDRKRGR